MSKGKCTPLFFLVFLVFKFLFLKAVLIFCIVFSLTAGAASKRKQSIVAVSYPAPNGNLPKGSIVRVPKNLATAKISVKSKKLITGIRVVSSPGKSQAEVAALNSSGVPLALEEGAVTTAITLPDSPVSVTPTPVLPESSSSTSGGLPAAPAALTGLSATQIVDGISNGVVSPISFTPSTLPNFGSNVGYTPPATSESDTDPSLMQLALPAVLQALQPVRPQQSNKIVSELAERRSSRDRDSTRSTDPEAATAETPEEPCSGPNCPLGQLARVGDDVAEQLAENPSAISIPHDRGCETQKLQLERSSNSPRVDLQKNSDTYNKILASGISRIAFDSALEAYKNPDYPIHNTEYLAVTDFSKPASEKRTYLINLKSAEVIADRTAHGSGSDKNYDGMLDCFSNIEDSNATPYGPMVTGGTYDGQNGLSLRMHGLTPDNNNTCKRLVVIHKAKPLRQVATPAGTKTVAALSWGCTTYDESLYLAAISRLQGGAMVFNYGTEAQRLNTSCKPITATYASLIGPQCLQPKSKKS